MNAKGRSNPAPAQTCSASAFTILELAVVIATIFLLAGLLLPALAKSRPSTQLAVDLNNVRQILSATTLYAADNSDYCPHSTWGTGGAGPSGWVYSTVPIAGVPSPGAVFSAMSGSEAQVLTHVSNQVHYFKAGQLARYAQNNQQTFECPTDVTQRRSGQLRTLYFQRQVKLTSYSFVGAVSGYGSPKTVANANQGGTYKLSGFTPTSFLLREDDERVVFNFNDAGSNQENPAEGVSSRHNGKSVAQGAIGPIMIGAFGGQASYIGFRKYNTLRNTPGENDLRCGPGYR